MTDTFDTDWNAAPESVWIDRQIAEYWWRKGRQAGERAGLEQANIDMKEMIRAGQERLR